VDLPVGGPGHNGDGFAVARVIDVAAARHLGEQAVQAARDLDDGRLVTRALAELCSAYYHAGEPQTALPLARESVDRARQLGDDVLLGRGLLRYLMAIAPDQPRQLVAEALACTERSGDHLTNSVLHNNAGFYALSTGNVPAARAHMDAAAQAAQAIGFQNTAMAANLGLVIRAEGDPDGARSAFEAGLRVSRRSGHNIAMANACLGLACLASDLGDWHRSAVLHGAAQAFLDRAGSPFKGLEARNRQDRLDHVRAHLGNEELELAYAQGMALSIDEVLELALRRAAPG
jgi:tetratricopeptide (TPR) repeat protein